MKDALRCPECHSLQDFLEGFTIHLLTTQEDEEQGLIRMALRCEWCGYATSFLGRPTLSPQGGAEEDGR